MVQQLDVAIVGAGISGTYSAWRIKEQNPEKEVSLYELSNRVGGRLLSLIPPGMPHVRCEMGAMRYMTNQPLIRSLVENELGLAYQNFPIINPTNIAYFRGVHLRINELQDSSKIPYQLPITEQEKNPANLIQDAIIKLIPTLKNLSNDDVMSLLRSYTMDGEQLYNWGFRNLLMKAMDDETYEFATKTLGYNTATWNWNAMDTIPTFLNGRKEQLETRTIKEGFEQVPIRLVEKFKTYGGNVYTSHRLVAFDVERNNSGVVQNVVLHFQLLDSNGCVRGQREVHSKKLILAMPRRSLELIDQTGEFLGGGKNDVMHQWIRSVSPNPLFKMFVCYPQPWWQSVEVTTGKLVTDLPIRQCFYWGTESEHVGANKLNSNSALLASYSDGKDRQFWSDFTDNPFQNEPEWYEDLQNPFVDKLGGECDTRWSKYRAPRYMVEEIHTQVTEAHNIQYAPQPYSAVYKDWGDDPYGGGVNFWNSHVKSWEMIPRMLKPISELPIYICGEAYSGTQGWVEGALQTAETMLEQHFGLESPSWITHHLGEPDE